jgi:uncharacterized membrane protein YfcA
MAGLFELLIALAAFAAGAIASVAGFGIGSILTPLLSLETGTRLAVAAVSIPHLAATFARFWMLRRHVDRGVLLHFGILSAGGGLVGALLHSVASNPALTLLFAVLLLFAGLTGLTGYARRLRFGPMAAWIAGAVSGVLGGLVGNQGGIRSAALLGFGLGRQPFVATATAIALMVDAARIPVYFVTAGHELPSAANLIVLGTIGVLAGTFSGTTILHRIPEPAFHRIVGIMILALGCFMLARAIEQQ